jgi:N-acetyl-gamma-glutamyl-phosphate reductase
VKAAVVGAGGYAGGELLRLLLQHPEVSDILPVSRSRAGERLGAAHPGLETISDGRFSGATAAEAARGRDVVFLALEHGVSSRIAAEVLAARPGLVVDLAADFRVSDLALYENAYGTHASPGLVPRFTYALADVIGPALRGRSALAVPGCFATAAQLALYPLAALGAAVRPVLFAVTGSSGAGALQRETTHHPTRAHNLFAYSVLHHRHEAEILQRWREWTGRPDARVRLMTHAGPFVRGIHLTLHAELNGAGPRPTERSEPGGALAPGNGSRPGDGAGPREWYERAYRGRPFVRLLSAPPELTHAIGTNHALIHVAASEDGTEVQVMVAVDNLIKGAAGQAVQAMNLALGLPEDAGLRLAGAWPC